MTFPHFIRQYRVPWPYLIDEDIIIKMPVESEPLSVFVSPSSGGVYVTYVVDPDGEPRDRIIRIAAHNSDTRVHGYPAGRRFIGTVVFNGYVFHFFDYGWVLR